MRELKPLILLVIVILAVTLWHRQADMPVLDNGALDRSSHHETAIASRSSGTSLPAFLPTEARGTLDRIARGGPFAHDQDGVTFGNYEGLLPKQPRGYYHEYTVETRGAHTRGARRIITGGRPPVVYYYTDDHYRSFRRFEWHR
jgi:ribonuclease T1